jgi:hypothetical protein
MRLSRATLALLCLGACSKRDVPASPPGAPTIEAADEVAEPVVYPTRPTPAFVPRENGACSSAYRLVEETCVHRYYEQNHAGGMAQAIAAYKRGVAPPMLGPVPVRPNEPIGPKPLDPGALTKRAAAGDAGTPRDRRLADLDAMLTAAREKLRQRDEASKAKTVEGASKRGAPLTATDTQAVSTALAQTTPGGSGSPTSNDPAVARLNELTQIANQLGSEQLKELTTELGRSGINTSALESLMRTEGGDNVQR